MPFGVSHGWPVCETIVTAGKMWNTVVEKSRDEQDADHELGDAGQAGSIVWMTVSGRLPAVVRGDHRDPEGQRDHHECRRGAPAPAC